MAAPSLQALMYVLTVGGAGGWLMTRAIRVRGAWGWIILTAPLAGVLFGIPSAALFAFTDAPAAAAVLGWAYPFAALVPAALVGSALPHLLAARRRRTTTPREHPAILLLKSLIGAAFCCVPAVLWIASGWIAGAYRAG